MRHWNAYYFDFSPYVIESTPKTLRLWFKKDYEGKPTEILEQTREWAFKWLKWFASTYSLALREQTYRKACSSDWCVEDKSLHKGLEPVAVAKVRTPATVITINKSSHKGRIEIKDREDAGADKERQRQLETDGVAKGVEYMFLKFPDISLKQTLVLEKMLEKMGENTLLTAEIAEILRSFAFKPPSLGKEGERTPLFS